MKLAWLLPVLFVVLPVSGQSQARTVSEQTYWMVVRASEDRANEFAHRKVTTNETLTGAKTEISRKDIVEYLPPDRQKFIRTNYEDGKVSTFELIKVGSHHYCRNAKGAWVKSLSWCGPNEMYSDPVSSDTKISLELVHGENGKVERYRYYSTYVFGEPDRTHFTEINTWIDAQKRIARTETRRGIVDSDERIFVTSEVYEYGPFKPAFEIKAPTQITLRSR